MNKSNYFKCSIMAVSLFGGLFFSTNSLATSIYEKIWLNDENRCTVTAGTMPSSSPNAEIILNEQVRAGGSRQQDLATNPLFTFVDETVFEKPTFKSFIKLLDNYIVKTHVKETHSPEEIIEIDDFLKKIMLTQPMKIAFEYVKTLDATITLAAFKKRVKTMWFKIYTNHYNNSPTPYCTGFEHVFVGEGSYSSDEEIRNNSGKVTGYHNWIKFYYDEKFGRVNYLGYKYDLNGEGPDQPIVVTLQMIWNQQNLQGDLIAMLFKEQGGFFVGSSPECEIALGTVAMYDLQNSNANRIPNVLINEGKFDLVLYRNTTENQKNGNYIRSFYPKYLGSSDSTVGSGSSGGIPPILSVGNAGDIIIINAMPNPIGSDHNGEWVNIKNTTSNKINLSEGYELRDKMSRPWMLSGELAPGEILKVQLNRSHPDTMQLGNGGGLITLHKNGTLLAVVKYTRTGEGQKVSFQEQ